MPGPGYQNWNEKLSKFETVEFLKLRDLDESIYRIYNRWHRSDYSTVVKAEFARFDLIKVIGICGPNKRFPDDGIYVNISSGAYADILSDLAEFAPPDRRLQRQLDYFLRKVPPYNETFTRTTFEKKFNLRWSDGRRWKRYILVSAGILILITMIANSK